MANVTAGNTINIGDLTQVQNKYGITNTAQYTTCQRAQIVDINAKNSTITIPAVGDTITAAAFNAIINATVLNDLANGTKIYFQETNDTYVLWYKVGNAGHYSSDTIPLIRANGVGAIKFNNNATSGNASSNTYNISGTSYLRDYLNVTWYGGLKAAAKAKLVQVNVPTRQHAGSSGTSIVNLSLYAWAASWKEVLNSGDAEGTQFPYKPPAITDTWWWSRSVVSGMAGYAKRFNPAVNGSDGNKSTTTTAQARPVICINKLTPVAAYSDGYRIIL